MAEARSLVKFTLVKFILVKFILVKFILVKFILVKFILVKFILVKFIGRYLPNVIHLYCLVHHKTKSTIRKLLFSLPNPVDKRTHTHTKHNIIGIGVRNSRDVTGKCRSAGGPDGLTVSRAPNAAGYVVERKVLRPQSGSI